MRGRAVAVAGVVVGLAAVGAGCSSAAGPAGPVQTTDPAAANYLYVPPSAMPAPSNVITDTSSPTPNAPVAYSATAGALSAAPEQVTYACKGDAPDGVDITYGPNGSNHSASSLPFSHTEPLTQGAQYYVTTAQLQGSGSVSCTTTVQTDNLDGTANDIVNSGSADGGYNIASAQVCSGIYGFEKC